LISFYTHAQKFAHVLPFNSKHKFAALSVYDYTHAVNEELAFLFRVMTRITKNNNKSGHDFFILPPKIIPVPSLNELKAPKPERPKCILNT